MGDEIREGDIRVPLVFCVFFVLLTAGGVLLVIYVFVPSASQPWYPTVAIVLVGSPWAFWLLTYLYTWAKACCRRASSANGGGGGRQISRRPTARNASSSAACKEQDDGESVASSKEPEMPLAYAV